jgi:hypothetical protein
VLQQLLKWGRSFSNPGHTALLSCDYLFNRCTGQGYSASELTRLTNATNAVLYAYSAPTQPGNVSRSNQIGSVQLVRMRCVQLWVSSLLQCVITMVLFLLIDGQIEWQLIRPQSPGRAAPKGQRLGSMSILHRALVPVHPGNDPTEPPTIRNATKDRCATQRRDLP